MKQFTLKSLLLVLTILMGGVNAWGETGSLTFGTNNTDINSSSVTASDNLGNSWTITTVGTTSFTENSDYSHVGSSKKPATSITFATTLPSAVNITSFSVKFGGFSGTAGTISLKVDNTEIGTGSLNAANDVTVENNTSASGKVLTISVTGISKGVKVYNLSYTYESAGSGPSAPTFSLAEGTYWKEQTLELTTTVENGIIYYTIDGNDPTETSDVYSAPIQISKTTTVKACVKVAEKFSDVVARTYNIVPSIANNPETAYTTAEAIDFIDKTSAEQLAAEDQKVYVKGVVSQVDSYDPEYKSITYWLDDNTFEVYSGLGLNGAEFGAISNVEVGASVVVYGNVKKFGKIYEFDKNSSLVEYNRNTLSSISISGDPNRVTYEEGESFDWTGLTVTAIFTGENTVDVTNSTTWTVVPDVLTMETTSVTVTATYKDKVATKDIPVSVSKALPKVTIDLSKDQTTTATTEKIEWVLDDIVVNSIKENSGKTPANNYYPGKSNYSSTRFYTNNSFNVIPAYYVIIKQITYTATTVGYASALAASEWTNATASADGVTVTIVPKDGAQPITAIIGATTGASSIVVSYEIIDHAEVGLPATDRTANYATFSSDRAVEFVDATVYAVNVVNGVLQLNEVTSKQVPAGNGVLLKSEKETAPYFYINEAATIDNNLNLLQPASQEMSGSYKFYKLAYDDYDAKTGLGFYWGAENGGTFTVKAGTAYLAVPNAVSVKGFLLDGTPTAIEGVEAENNTDVIYNLSGQRVQKAQRGLYIVNGKKLMVK